MLNSKNNNDSDFRCGRAVAFPLFYACLQSAGKARPIMSASKAGGRGAPSVRKRRRATTASREGACAVFCDKYHHRQQQPCHTALTWLYDNPEFLPISSAAGEENYHLTHILYMLPHILYMLLPTFCTGLPHILYRYMDRKRRIIGLFDRISI